MVSWYIYHIFLNSFQYWKFLDYNSFFMLAWPFWSRTRALSYLTGTWTLRCDKTLPNPQFFHHSHRTITICYPLINNTADIWKSYKLHTINQPQSKNSFVTIPVLFQYFVFQMYEIVQRGNSTLYCVTRQWIRRNQVWKRLPRESL